MHTAIPELAATAKISCVTIVPNTLPPELLSRFLVFDFKPYSEREFIEVAIAVITRHLGKDPKLAEHIARRVVQRSRDVRQAVQLAKLVETRGEVDRFFGDNRENFTVR